MPNGTVRLTSPGHPMAIAAWLTGSFVGAITIAGLASAKSMTSIIGADLVIAWGAIAAASGLLAAAMGLIGRVEPPSQSRLRIELTSLAVLSMSYLWYEITLVIGNGISEVLITQGLATGIFIGSAARAIEILFEVRRVRIEPKVGE